MNYISTRGGMAPLPFSDILLEGLAPDGGLAVPEQLPQISAETLESWRGLPYADLAFEVLSRFATDIPAEDLRRLTTPRPSRPTFMGFIAAPSADGR